MKFTNTVCTLRRNMMTDCMRPVSSDCTSATHRFIIWPMGVLTKKSQGACSSAFTMPLCKVVLA